MKQKRDIYPMDVSTLAKGMTIDAKTCCDITGSTPESRNHGLRLVGLCETIMRLAEDSGRALPCRIVGDAIEIMDDETAAKYYASQFLAGIRQCGRAHRRQTHYVDRAQLCTESQAKYDRSTALQAMITQSNRGIIRKFSRQIETENKSENSDKKLE